MKGNNLIEPDPFGDHTNAALRNRESDIMIYLD